MDKMDDFFKKNLLDHSPAPDGWNTPSDDLWNKAKPHFPKRKQSNKRAWLLWSSLILLILSIAGWSLINTSNNTINPASADITPSSITSINEKQPALPLPDLKNTDKSAEIIDKTSSKDAAGTLSLTPDRLEATSKDLNIVHSDRKSKSAVSKIKLTSDSAVSTSNKTISLTSTTLPIQNVPKNASQQRLLASNPNPTQSASAFKSNQETKLIPVLQQVPVTTIDPFTVASSQIRSDLPEYAQPTPLAAILVATRPRFEFGIAASTHPAAVPYTKFNNINGLESITANATYTGMNYQASILAHKNLSISSGMYFSNQNVDVELTIVDIYEEDDAVQTEEFKVKSRKLGAEIETDVIDFFPGVVVEDGDVLRYDGRADLRINSMRIPFMLNFHMRKQRFEFLLTAGVSFGMNEIKFEDGELEIRRMNELIAFDNNPPEVVYFPQASAFYGGSLKYHILPKLNVGVSMFVDKRAILPDQYFRLEYGLFLRL